MLKNMKKKLCIALLKFPKTCLASSVLVGLLLSVGIIFSYQSDFSSKVWFLASNPHLIAFNDFEEEFGNDDLVVVAIKNKSGVFNQRSVEFIREATRDLWLVPGVINVQSLANHQWARSEDDDVIIESLFPLIEHEKSFSDQFIEERKKIVLDDPELENFLINKDATVTLLYARLKPQFEDQLPYVAAYKASKLLLEKYRASYGGDHEVHLLGSVIVQSSLEELMIQDFSLLTVSLILIIASLIFFLYRDIRTIFQVLAVILVASFATGGLFCWLGFVADPLSILITPVMLTICVADAVHIISTFYHFHRRGISKQRAVYAALVKNLRPTLMTTFTTAIGFLGLYSSMVKPIANFGFLVSIGAILAWAYTYFMLIPLLVLSKASSKRVRKEKENGERDLGAKFICIIERWKKSIVLVFALTSLLMFYLATLNEVDSDTSRYVSKSHPIRIARDFVKESFGSYSILELVINSGKENGVKEPEFLKKVEAMGSSLEKHKNITKTRSAVNIVKDVNQSIFNDDEKQWIIPEKKANVAEALFLYDMSLPLGLSMNYWTSLDYQKMRMSTWINVNSTRDSLKVINEIGEIAEQHELDVVKTGKTSLTSQISPLVVRTFLSSILLSLIFISLTMALIFKSWQIGLISMLPNVVPLILGGGIMKLIGFPLDVGTSVVASISLGIAVDDTIHILNDYLSARKNNFSPQLAIRHSFERAGKAVMVTTLLLGCGFFALSMGRFAPTVELGVMTAVTIVAALLTDLLLLPAIFLLWPSLGKPKNTVSE